MPIYTLSPDLTIETWNPGAELLNGYSAEEVIGKSVRLLCPDEDYKAIETLSEEARRSGRALSVDARRRRKNGSIFEIIFCLAPICAPDGELTGYAAISHDITERKAQENTRQLLLQELNHRVKNTLAMVQSIASLTLRSTERPEDFVQSFTGRIHALAAAHDVLTASSWHGADLMSLVRDQLLLGDGTEGRFTCEGPQIKLIPQAAVGLSLVLHELGANARKYGALSVPTGHVAISWAAADGEALQLRWRERGGPAVAPPARRGFGSVIIGQSLSAVDGGAEVLYDPAGVVCDITLPLDGLERR